MGEEAVPKGSLVVIAVAIGVAMLGHRRLWAQQEDEPEPCAGAVRQADVNVCWAREAERADDEMKQVYLALLQKLPPRLAENLKKAQKLWLEFRDAHVATLYGGRNPLATYGSEYAMCLSIARWELARDRTRELRRLLHPEEDRVCPL
jgi:uncharacterized protein YecT (DUF1311 family)